MARPRTPKIPKPPRIENLPENFLRYETLPADFLKSFRNNITCSVAFVKDDNSVRTMAFRKRLSSYDKLRSTNPKSEKESNILPNNNMFRAYDVNLYKKALAEYNGDSVKASGKAYRTFYLDRVLALMWGGNGFEDFREKNQIMERFGPEVYNQLPENMAKRKLKNDIQSADSESGEPLQENFKNMKKKINLNEFKSLIKRIIKEEKNNLTKRKNKVVRITESQLRNQVRKMLREFDNYNPNDDAIDNYNDYNDYDDAMRDYYDEKRGYRSEEGSINIDPLPNGDVLDVDFNIEASNDDDEPSWTITTAYLYTDNGEGKINIYDPKYADILKIVEKRIYEYMEDNGWYRDYDDPDTYHQPQI